MVVCTDEATACTDGDNRTEHIRVWKETKEPDKEAMVLNGRGNVYTLERYKYPSVSIKDLRKIGSL